ncbi:MAG TPA: MmcQ/YjbR family DNA-binding protein [Rhodothermales bacterium]|nr:MmcQ/YjbR family DNA-binding protein [Rhodothermales bacterium]
MSPSPLDRLRALCLALPEATEKEAWGEPTFRVAGRMFASYATALNHHGDGREAVWCPASPGAQAALVESAPDRFFVPPYVGGKGWIGIDLDAVDDDELGFHLQEAYLTVAPKRLAALLD